MLENNNLSYTAQNHSSITIWKHFVYRGKMNITALNFKQKTALNFKKKSATNHKINQA